MPPRRSTKRALKNVPAHSRLGIAFAVVVLVVAMMTSTAAALSPTTEHPSSSTSGATTSQKTPAAVLSSSRSDRQALEPPSALLVTAVSATGLTLSWAASNGSVDVAGYGVYVNGTRIGTTALRSFGFSALSCGTTYEVGVDSFDVAKNRSIVTSVLAASAPCLDVTAPSAPSYIRRSSGGQTGLSLQWGAASDNVGVAGYRIYKDGVPVAVTQQTSLWLANLVCAAGYSVAVEAYDTAGNDSARAAAFVSTDACTETMPSTPASLVVSGSTASSISLTWRTPANARGVIGYRVSVDDREFGSTTATSMTVGSLRCGVSYSIAVVGFDAAGHASAAATVIAATAACAPPARTGDTRPPTVPSGLTQSGGTPLSISLSWIASSDNIGVIGYGVYREGTKVADTSAAAHVLAGLTCATSYNLSVDAVDAAGNRSGRAALVATTAGCVGSSAPTAPTGLVQLGRTETSIILSWQSSSDDSGGTSYRVFRDGVQVATTASTTYPVSGLACGTSYTFGVGAHDAAGNHRPRSATILSTSACSDVVAPTAPSSVRMTDATATTVSLAWGAATDDTGVAGYTLYVGGAAIGTTAQTVYSFSGLECGTEYAFDVESYDTAGNRSPRLSLTASTSACVAPAPAPSGSVYVAPGGSDSSPCTQTQPCRSFGRAYKAAASGATVSVAAGTYPSQEIDQDPTKSSGTPVVFQPASGTVTVDGTLDFGQAQFDRRGPKGVTIKNMRVTYLRSWLGSSTLLWENVVGKHFDIFDSSDVTVRGGNYGPCEAPRDDASCVSRIDGDNVLVENTVIRDVTSTDLANYHVDGMFVRDGSNIVVRSTKFYGNMITNIRVQNCCGGTVRNLTLENNSFGAPLQADGVSIRADGIDIDDQVPGLLVRFNSFAEKTGIQSTATQSDARFVGNLVVNFACAAGVAYSYNVYMAFSDFTGQSPCGSTDKKVTSFGYANNSGGSGFDPRLAVDGGGVDYVPISIGCPSSDFEGTPRPQGGACDAGADER